MSVYAWLRFDEDGSPPGPGLAERSGRWGGLFQRQLGELLPTAVRTDGEHAYALVSFVPGVAVVLLNGATLGRWHVHEGRVGPFTVQGGGCSIVPELDAFLDGLLCDALRDLGLRALTVAT